MRILEKAKPGATFTAGEVIEEEITLLIVRMWDFMQIAEEPQYKVVEAWRDELTHIRYAICKLLKV